MDSEQGVEFTGCRVSDMQTPNINIAKITVFYFPDRTRCLL